MLGHWGRKRSFAAGGGNGGRNQDRGEGRTVGYGVVGCGKAVAICYTTSTEDYIIRVSCLVFGTSWIQEREGR